MNLNRKQLFLAGVLLLPSAALIFLLISERIRLDASTEIVKILIAAIIILFLVSVILMLYFFSRRVAAIDNKSNDGTEESAGSIKKSFQDVAAVYSNSLNHITPTEITVESEELLKSGFLFAKVWNITTDGMRLTDKTGNIITINNAFCGIVNLSRDTLLYKPFVNIYKEDLRQDIMNEYLEDFRSGNVKAGFERETVLWNGKKVWLEFSNSLLHISDSNTLMLSTIKDITERKKSEASLKRYAQQLRSLASRLQLIREEERTMIAREIHDELGQVLTVLKIQITLLANKLRDDQPELKEKILNAAKVIDETVESVQKISAKLRPGILDNLGLVPAIEWQAQEYQKNTGIKCECYLPKDDIILNEEKSTAVFRIFQEALTNAGRHSSADVVMISLFKNNGALTLSISDNGCGITEAQKNDPNSLGLLGMKERVLLLNGEFEIFGKENRGTTVRAIVPLEYPGESFY